MMNVQDMTEIGSRVTQMFCNGSHVKSRDQPRERQRFVLAVSAALLTVTLLTPFEALSADGNQLEQRGEDPVSQNRATPTFNTKGLEAVRSRQLRNTEDEQRTVEEYQARKRHNQGSWQIESDVVNVTPQQARNVLKEREIRQKDEINRRNRAKSDARREGNEKHSFWDGLVDFLIPAAKATEPFIAGPGAAVNAEIDALARDLRMDVDLIFQYVHDRIRYEPTYGRKKGALGTLLDQSGNAFDQAELMIELLKAAGHSSARFISGKVRLDPFQYSDLLGVKDASDVVWVSAAFGMFAQGGIPADFVDIDLCIAGTNPVLNCSIEIDHVWVRVDVGGTNYVFDPAIKQVDFLSRIDLGAAMGYVQSDLINTAKSGATETSDYIKNINVGNIESELETLSSDLRTHLQQNHPDVGLDEVVRGSKIVPVSGIIRQTSLTYQVAEYAVWTGVPLSHSSTLDITVIDASTSTNLLTLSAPLVAAEIYTDRLTIKINSNNQPVLLLDGSILETGSTPSNCSTSCSASVVFVIDHAYPGVSGTMGDQSGTQTIAVESGNLFAVVNSWGVAGRGTIEKHRKALNTFKEEGKSDTSEEVLGSSLAMLGSMWVVQSDIAVKLAGNVHNVGSYIHHRVGIAGQAQSPYVDLPLVNRLLVGRFAESAEGNFLVGGSFMSGLEHGVIEQGQPIGGVSTVRLLTIAAQSGQKIYDFHYGNYATIKPLLVNYSTGEKNALVGLVDSATTPSTIVLPEDGDIQKDDWIGHAYWAINPYFGSGNYIIQGGLSGGFGAVEADTEPSFFQKAQRLANKAASAIRSIDPIDLGRGDFLYDSDDISVGAEEIPYGIGFQRSYNSARRLIDGDVGLGWTHNFAISATEDSNPYQGFGEDSHLDAVAALVTFYVNNDLLESVFADLTATPTRISPLDRLLIGAIVANWGVDQLTENTVVVDVPGATQQFVRLPDGSFNPPPGSADTLSVVGGDTYKLTQKNGIELEFDTDGKIETWTDPNGNTLTFSYGGDDTLDSTSSSFGRSLSFAYNTNSQIESVSDGNGRSVHYGYDSDGNLTSFTNAEGEATFYEYDVPGRLHKVYVPEYPKDTGVENAIVENTYDIFDRVKEQFNTERELYQYFYSGFRTEEIDPLDNSTIYEYDDRGKLLSKTDAEGRRIETGYDVHGRLEEQIFPEGNSVEYEYDDNHNVTKIIQNPKPGSIETPIEQSFVYEATYNKPTSATDARGNTTTFKYFTGTPNIEWIEQPEPTAGTGKPKTTFTYIDTGGGNTNGLVETRTDPEGRVTKFEYDAATGGLKKTIRDEGTGRLNLTTEFTYDGVGNLKTQSDPRDSLLVTTFDYDEERRLIRTTSPAPFNYESELIYDQNGRVIETRTDTGDVANPVQVTTVTYTRFDKQKSVTDALGHVTSFEYDDANRLERVTDAEGRQTEFTYYDDGLADEVTQVLSGGDVVVRKNTYTTNGRLHTVTDAEGNVTTFGYDDFDRPNKTTYPDPVTGAPDKFELVEYDPAGNIIESTNRAGDMTLFEYDTLNREILKNPPGTTIPSVVTTYDKTGLLDKITVSATDEFDHDYDTAGRLNKVTRADGKVIEYDYDEAGNRTSLTYPGSEIITYEYDELGRPEKVKEGTTVLAEYTYSSRLSGSVTYANGTSSTYALSLNGELSQLINDIETSPPTYDLYYNKTGQVINRRLSDSAYAWAPSGTSDDDYTPNSLNQYGSVNATTYTYDDNGNLTDDDAAGGNAYTYDYENRLITATDGTTSSTYVYDEFGRRESKTVGSTTTDYVYDGGTVLEEYDGTTREAFYVYAPGVDTPIFMERASTRYYYHFDANGSVAAISDAGGTVVERYAYGPYGQTDDTSSVENPYLYTGRRFDPETGFYYYRNRYYSVSLGRFLQPDPIGFGDGLNLYAYVGNDPLNFVDPTGLLAAEVGRAGYSLLQSVSSGTTKSLASISIGIATTIPGLTTPAASTILNDFRSGNGENRFYGVDSVASQELAKGKYVQELTANLSSQFAQEHGGAIPDGARFSENTSAPFRNFGAADYIQEAISPLGFQVSDVVGSFTSPVEITAQGGNLIFTATNRTSLASFAGENILRHGLVVNPESGPFSTTTQTFQWSVPILAR